MRRVVGGDVSTRGRACGSGWLPLVMVSTVLAVSMSSIAWTNQAGAAATGTVQPNYPAVDISKFVVHEPPAGTPQTTATGATGSTDPLVAGRALDPSYREKEFVVQGVASMYAGPITVRCRSRRRTCHTRRVLVRMPADPKKFSGRVVVEPFNTTNNGTDLDAVWDMTAPLLQQRGDAWVGVTERTSAGQALKQSDPTRYADIDVPTNDVAWDVLAQVGAAIKQGGTQSPLPGLKPKYLYMAGYSQSGVDTAGFAIGLAKHYGTPSGKPLYDGYFPAAHAASVTPLKAGTSVLPKFEYPVQTAVGVPVLNLEDESGVEGFTAELPASAQATLGQKDYTNVSSASVRRADSDKPGDQYRLYEVAGMPHAPGGDGGCEGPGSTFPVAAVTRGTFAS